MEVTVRAHWINGWFLESLARPAVEIDGVEHPAVWGAPCRVEVESGARRVAAGARYRGTSTRLLGRAPRLVAVGDGETVRLHARNGLLNSDPFKLAPERTPKNP